MIWNLSGSLTKKDWSPPWRSSWLTSRLGRQGIEKKLRPNDLAEWELRVEAFRVFYDVVPENEIVKVVAIGVKEGNDLFIHGEKYEL